MVTKKRELFDAGEFDQKMSTMIEKLRRQKPGQAVGLVGKNDVLKARRVELQKLIDDGYTVAQIVEAMKNDVFDVLPKTITEVLNNKAKKTTKQVLRRAATKPENKSPPPAEPVAPVIKSQRTKVDNFVNVD